MGIATNDIVNFAAPVFFVKDLDFGLVGEKKLIE